MQLSRCALALLAFTGLAEAQMGEGQFIATVIVSPPAPAASFGELYLGDTALRTVTKLNIPQKLTDDRLNAVIMTSPTAGYVSTIPNTGGGNGDVFAITLSGNTVTASQVNTTAMPGTSIAQLHFVAPNTIYFASAGGTGAGGLPGVLGRIVGGTPSILVDFATVSGASGPVNALAVSGNRAFVGTFTSGSSATEAPSMIWDVNLATNVATKLADVPVSKFNTGGAPFNAGPVNLQMDPNTPTTLVVQGVYGDIYRYNITNASLIDHRFSGPTTTAASNTNSVNSLFIDARTGDYLEGTRDGNGDLFVLEHNGEKVYPGLGSGTVASQNSVTGIWYSPFTRGLYTAFGTGCPGTGGFTPTSFGLGTPRAGTLWGMGVASGPGGGLGVLLVGTSNTLFGALPLPLSLAGIGKPGCNLRVNVIVVLNTVLAGSGGTGGTGLAAIPLLLPPDTRGVVAYTQWMTFNGLLLDAVSDGRKVEIQ